MSNSSSDDVLPTFWNPGIGKYHQAVRIPVTTPTRYLSYSVALNLRLPGEDTGDWHGDVQFVTPIDTPPNPDARRAGRLVGHNSEPRQQGRSRHGPRH